jgi:A/G-specific adenine glycosylase
MDTPRWPARRAGAALSSWFEPRRSLYPWRSTAPDPYRVLVSEVMLQQTQASRVAPAFVAFVERFPTVAALAAAPRSAVVRAWDGLGYNRRAVALSEAAGRIERDHGGRVPGDEAALRALPGVGPYTAAAVASLAFGATVPAIDTNVRRVVARAALGREPGDAPAAEVRHAAADWLDPADPGGWNQAVMDLGRTVCRPLPRCDVCPLAPMCRLVAAGRPTGSQPRRAQARFEGSSRQARGAVVRALRRSDGLTLLGLAEQTGLSGARLVSAVRSLAADGVIAAGPAAEAGRPGGRVRLAD